MEDELKQFQEFASEHPKLLLIAANPSTDEIVTMFNGKGSHVSFPKSDDITKNFVFKMLFDSVTYRESANQFLVGLMKSVGTDEKSEGGNQVFSAIMGTTQSLLESNLKD